MVAQPIFDLKSIDFTPQKKKTIYVSQAVQPSTTVKLTSRDAVNE